MFFRKTRRIKSLEKQVANLGRQAKRLSHENEILLLFRKEIEQILQEQHYGSVDNFSKKIRSAISDSHRLLHF